MPTYAQLKATHPEYDADYWRVLRAFYEGGKKLLGDTELLKKVFPPRAAEPMDVYRERCDRAFYIPYPGQLIDYITALLGSDPITITADPAPADEEFWTAFLAPDGDVSEPGGKEQSFNQLLRAQVLTALQLRTAWTMADLPIGKPDAPVTLAEEDATGARRAYLCSVDPECVLDWEEDDSGELQYVVVLQRSKRRAGLSSTRKHVREEFTFYDAAHWERYVVEYDVDDKGNPKNAPKDADEIQLESSGPHTFGCVPFERFALPPGLWAMGKIESLAREHFNTSAALAWGMYKGLFQFLQIGLDSDAANDATDDVGRGTNQPIGPGRAWVGGAKDIVRYVAPESAPFEVAMKRLAELRDEMHRVLHSMAQSIDNSGAALQRSAASKQVDQASTAVVLGKLGQLMREHAARLVRLVERGRKDIPAKWGVGGGEEFDEITLSTMIEEAAVVETLKIPSRTFWVRWKSRLALRLLGSGASDEDAEEISDEIDGAITQEDVMGPPSPPPMPPDPNAPPAPEPAPAKAPVPTKGKKRPAKASTA